MQPEVLLLLKLLELLLLLLKLLLLLLKIRDKKGQPNKQLQSSADRTEQLMYSSSDRKGQLDKQLHSSADKTEPLPAQEQRLYTILASNSLITLKRKSFSIASCKSSQTPKRLSIGLMRHICGFCGAKHFLCEKTGGTMAQPVFSNCCYKGKV